MALARENISEDKREQLLKITGDVYVTQPASGKLEDSHAEKPEVHLEGQDRRSQDIAAFVPRLSSRQESMKKGGPAGSQPGNAAWCFLSFFFFHLLRLFYLIF